MKMSDAKYGVGHIVFVVPKGKSLVYPMLIVEEITRRTASGTVMDYVLRGSDPKNCIDMKSVNGEVFETSDKALQVLTARATAGIKRLVDSAVLKASQWFSDQTAIDTVDDDGIITSESLTADDADMGPVVMIDGKPVKVHLPDVLLQ